MSGGTYGLMDCPISMLLMVGRVILPGDMALFHRFIHVSESSSLTPGVPGMPEPCMALHDADESIVTSSTGELAFCWVVIIPHIYWSTSSPSKYAVLLENNKNINIKCLHFTTTFNTYNTG